MKKYDVIVVGGGMAGLTAGIYVVRAGKTILVLEAGAVGGQIITAPSVENWPGSFRMSGSNLMKDIAIKSDGTWVAIGRYDTSGFAGVFLGNGKIISH